MISLMNHRRLWRCEQPRDQHQQHCNQTIVEGVVIDSGRVRLRAEGYNLSSINILISMHEENM